MIYHNMSEQAEKRQKTGVGIAKLIYIIMKKGNFYLPFRHFRVALLQALSMKK